MFNMNYNFNGLLLQLYEDTVEDKLSYNELIKLERTELYKFVIHLTRGPDPDREHINITRPFQNINMVVDEIKLYFSSDVYKQSIQEMREYLDYLKNIRKSKFLSFKQKGLCLLIAENGHKSTFGNVLLRYTCVPYRWEHFYSGCAYSDPNYPIPSTRKGMSSSQCFSKTFFKWMGKQGKYRRSLLDFHIKEYEDILNFFMNGEHIWRGN